MNNIKVIYRFVLDQPYVNIQPGIISTLTYKNLTAIRKTDYQPAEKEIFDAAGVSLKQEIIPRLSERRFIQFAGIPPLTKVSDDTFQFEVSGDETILDDGTREKKVLEQASNIFFDLKERLNDGQENYNIISFKKVVCKSDICLEEETVITRKRTKSVLDF